MALYIVLIPPYGGVGAALATLGGFAFLAVCTWRVTQWIFPVRYEWPRLAAAIALTAGLWLASPVIRELSEVPAGVARFAAALAARGVRHGCVSVVAACGTARRSLTL